jgi:hypothetical protein
MSSESINSIKQIRKRKIDFEEKKRNQNVTYAQEANVTALGARVDSIRSLIENSRKNGLSTQSFSVSGKSDIAENKERIQQQQQIPPMPNNAIAQLQQELNQAQIQLNEAKQELQSQLDQAIDSGSLTQVNDINQDLKTVLEAQKLTQGETNTSKPQLKTEIQKKQIEIIKLSLDKSPGNKALLALAKDELASLQNQINS